MWWSISILTFLMIVVAILNGEDMYDRRKNVTIISLFWLLLIFPGTPVGVWFKQNVLEFEKEWDKRVKKKDCMFFIKRYAVVWGIIAVLLFLYLLIREYII